MKSDARRGKLDDSNLFLLSEDWSIGNDKKDHIFAHKFRWDQRFVGG